MLWCTINVSCTRRMRAAWIKLGHHCHVKCLNSKWRNLCRKCVVSSRRQTIVATSVRMRPKRLCRLVFSRWQLVTWRRVRVSKQVLERTTRARCIIRLLLQRWKCHVLSCGWHRWLHYTRLIGQQMRSVANIMVANALRESRKLLSLRREFFGRWRLTTALHTRHQVNQKIKTRLICLQKMAYAFGWWKRWMASCRAQRRRISALVSMHQRLTVRFAWRKWENALRVYHSRYLKFMLVGYGCRSECNFYFCACTTKNCICFMFESFVFVSLNRHEKSSSKPSIKSFRDKTEVFATSIAMLMCFVRTESPQNKRVQR